MLINFQNLKYFEVVARTEHFTQAASELFISQSALSKAISNLEQEIGVPLFERHGRNVQLTRYGKIFRDYVHQGNLTVEEGIHQIQDMANIRTGEIRISSIFTMGANFIPDVISSYIQTYPNANIFFTQKATKEIISDVISGETDLGFCGEYIKQKKYEKIASELVLTEELCLLVRKDHPLASRESIDFREVVNETFVGYNKNTGIIHSIERTLRNAGITTELNIKYSATEDSTIVSMVRSGLGIALIADIPHIYTEGLVRIKIDNPFFYRNLYLIWNQGRYFSPAIKNFKYYLLSHI